MDGDRGGVSGASEIVIIILEGFNGTGKTTLATSLATLLGYRVYRPLREGNEGHWDDESSLVRELKRCDVPLNSFIDDVFAVDAIDQLGSRNVVLDRSLPSALAYDLMSTDRQEAVESYWIRRLKRINESTPVLYLWMRLDHGIAKVRSGGRYPPEIRWRAMEMAFQRSFDALQRAGIRARIRYATTPLADQRFVLKWMGETKNGRTESDVGHPHGEPA